MDYKRICKEHLEKFGKPIAPISHRSKNKVPENVRCPYCNASHDFLYFNDGKKKSQIKCKVCSNLFQLDHRFRNRNAKYFCPHCGNALFVWKRETACTIHKCQNDNCSAYLKAIEKLNISEKKLQKVKSSQFKLRYQYREYHFKQNETHHSAPKENLSAIDRIHNSLHIIALVLTFHISFGLAARKTASVLRNVFGVKISYQTVLNYAEIAAWYCHNFNHAFKGEIDDISAGDETYIKIQGKNAYVFFFISANNRKITACHVANNRETLPAVTAMQEAIRTARPDQQITLVTDGNPSYPAGLHFINKTRADNSISLKKVIGLQNLDAESEEFRSFKQIIERLNRTYKSHTRSAYGFNSNNGAIVLTTLFTTHYNFIRPHQALKYKPPIIIDDIEAVNTFQGKWCKIINLAQKLPNAA